MQIYACVPYSHVQVFAVVQGAAVKGRDNDAVSVVSNVHYACMVHHIVFSCRRKDKLLKCLLTDLVNGLQ